jgi:beta-lactamase class A
MMLASCGHRPLGRILDLGDLEQRHGGRLGIAVTDSATGRTLGWRANERFAYCSTFKLFLAAATLERVQRGQEQLQRPVAITAADVVPHAPVTGPAVGRTLTIRELCKGTVEVSDNPAANILIRELGGLGAFRSWYAALGDRVTRVDRLEPELNSALPGDARDTTTPAQAVADLALLFGRRQLREDLQTLLLRWLIDSPTGVNRIKAAAPAGSIVAHKTGTSDGGPTNDIGVVWPAGARSPSFVAAYFTESRLPTVAAREAVLADGVRRAVAALASEPRGVVSALT